jgi:hypothetical protein
MQPRISFDDKHITTADSNNTASRVHIFVQAEEYTFGRNWPLLQDTALPLRTTIATVVRIIVRILFGVIKFARAGFGIRRLRHEDSVRETPMSGPSFALHLAGRGFD